MIFVVREPRPFILEVKITWTSLESQNELMREMRLRIRNHRILVHCLSINFMSVSDVFLLFLSFVPMSFDSVFPCYLT